MNPLAPENQSNEPAQLGEPKMVFRASRRSLFWSVTLALLPATLGITVLALAVRTLAVQGLQDGSDAIVFLVVGVLSLWGARVLWKQANRLRRLQVVVHTDGLVYRDGRTTFSCRWSQIAQARGRVAHHYDKTSLAVGGVVPIPGATVSKFSHVSHRYTLRREDGAEIVFTDEIQDVEELGRVIQQELDREAFRWALAQQADTRITAEPHHTEGKVDAAGITSLPPPTSPIGEDALEPAKFEMAPPDRLAEFHLTLASLTPRVYVTPVLIGINVLVFVLMSASGVSLTEPTIPDLLRWGADFGPSTTRGEWWRLLTCVFVHIGILHILLNMWVLTAAGPLVERMIGNAGFLVMYLVAGLCGSLASLFWNPLLVSAGASGAIFGVYGALVGILLREHQSVPTKALTQLRNSGLGFLGYNLLFGMMHARIDSAAHIGGLVAGFLCGLVQSQPFTPAALAGRTSRNFLVFGLGIVLVLGGMLGVHAKSADIAEVHTALEHFQTVEKKALETYNSAVSRAQRQELNDAAFADFIDREVLPPWRDSRERLAALKQIPAPLQSQIASILEYMRLRQEAWELVVQALREDNDDKARQAAEKQKLADAAAQRISNSGGK
jgi:rhomboid protease GluP